MKASGLGFKHTALGFTHITLCFFPSALGLKHIALGFKQSALGLKHIALTDDPGHKSLRECHFSIARRAGTGEEEALLQDRPASSGWTSSKLRGC